MLSPTDLIGARRGRRRPLQESGPKSNSIQPKSLPPCSLVFLLFTPTAEWRQISGGGAKPRSLTIRASVPKRTMPATRLATGSAQSKIRGGEDPMAILEVVIDSLPQARRLAAVRLSRYPQTIGAEAGRFRPEFTQAL